MDLCYLYALSKKKFGNGSTKTSYYLSTMKSLPFDKKFSMMSIEEQVQQNV